MKKINYARDDYKEEDYILTISYEGEQQQKIKSENVRR